MDEKEKIEFYKKRYDELYSLTKQIVDNETKNINNRNEYKFKKMLIKWIIGGIVTIVFLIAVYFQR